MPQGPALHQNGGNGATTHIKLSFDNGALCSPSRIGLKLKDLGLQRDRFQQFIKTLPGDRRHFHVLHFTGHLLNDYFVLQQLGAHFVGISLWFVDLVDRHDHRHFGRLGMVDRLNRLRHHRIVCRHNQHNNVCHLRTTGPHGCKRRVARSIQEAQDRTTVGFHLIGPDMLGDAAGLSVDNLGIPDRIQNRGLAVVHVTHTRDHRWARLQIVFAILDRINNIFHIRVGHACHFVTELFND